MDTSWGLFVSALVGLGMYKLAGEEFAWWMLLICLVTIPLVDGLVHGKTNEEGVYIEDDV